MKQPHFEHVCEPVDRVPARGVDRVRAPFLAGTVEGIVPMGRTLRVG